MPSGARIQLSFRLVCARKKTDLFSLLRPGDLTIFIRGDEPQVHGKLSLGGAVEMWKTPRTDGALVTNRHFNHVMVNRRRSSQSQSGEQMHTQMLSFEDSAIRNASFSGDVGERVQR